ncbi:MAG TPA: DNA glycosylase [Opitutaceae bacterium]|nr:DNA glycosylase [Opitutaceae bacterium]
MPSRLSWTDWQPLPLPEPLTAPVLAEVLDGGQAFRWSPEADGTWQGVWDDCVVQLQPAGDGGVRWRTPRPLAATAASKLAAYLGAATGFARLADELPWRSDAHLARCLAAFPGLRLLRQPLGETLLCFLCSATKQIVQIRQMVALLARRHGRELAPGFHRLPTWAELAAVSETDLRACQLGFRAGYVVQTARFLADRPGWLESLSDLPHAAAQARLQELPGVGEKIADCVLLFGAGRLEAFPVDVWILRAMARHYGLEGWAPRQVAHFGRVHFGPLAGLAQQYLFAWERTHGRD